MNEWEITFLQDDNVFVYHRVLAMHLEEAIRKAKVSNWNQDLAFAVKIELVENDLQLLTEEV